MERIILFAYDGWQVVEEYRIQSSAEREATLQDKPRLVADYVYGLGIDEPLRMRRDLNNDGYFDSVSETFFYYENGMGSIHALADGAGNVVERYDYTTYGEVRVYGADGVTEREESLVGNVYGFHGRRIDWETVTATQSPLYYFRHRIYSPTLQRFLQPKDISAPEGTVSYNCFFNSPTVFFDPYAYQEKKNLVQEPGLEKWNSPEEQTSPFKPEHYSELRGYDWIQKVYWARLAAERVSHMLEQVKDSKKSEELYRTPEGRQAANILIAKFNKALKYWQTALRFLKNMDETSKKVLFKAKPEGIEGIKDLKIRWPVKKFNGKVIVVPYGIPKGKSPKGWLSWLRWVLADLPKNVEGETIKVWANKQLTQGAVIIEANGWGNVVEALKVVGAHFGPRSIRILMVLGHGPGADYKWSPEGGFITVGAKKVYPSTVIKETPKFISEYFTTGAQVWLAGCRTAGPGGQNPIYSRLMEAFGYALLATNGGQVKARTGRLYKHPIFSPNWSSRDLDKKLSIAGGASMPKHFKRIIEEQKRLFLNTKRGEPFSPQIGRRFR